MRLNLEGISRTLLKAPQQTLKSPIACGFLALEAFSAQLANVVPCLQSAFICLYFFLLIYNQVLELQMSYSTTHSLMFVS